MTALNRRQFAALAGGALTGVASARPARAAEEVVFASFGGSIEQFLRKSVIPVFEQESGIKVTYVVGTAMSLYSKLMATRARPEIDIYWANDLLHESGKLLGLYAPIDPKLVTNQENLIDGGKQADGIGVLSQIASSGIQYNTEKFKQMGWAPPTSWLDLWDPKYKGRLAMYSINILYAQELLGIMSRLTGGNEKNIAPGLKKIRELKEMGQIAATANTPAEMDNIMAQGQAWITYNGCNRVLTVKGQGAPFEFVNPKEGAARYALYLNPIKGAPHPQALQKFINFMLRADIQTLIAANIFYGPVNRDAKTTPDMAAAIGLGGAPKLMLLDRKVMNQELDNWIEQWNRVIETK